MGKRKKGQLVLSNCKEYKWCRQECSGRLTSERRGNRHQRWWRTGHTRSRTHGRSTSDESHPSALDWSSHSRASTEHHGSRAKQEIARVSWCSWRCFQTRDTRVEAKTVIVKVEQSISIYSQKASEVWASVRQMYTSFLRCTFSKHLLHTVSN